MHILRKLLRSFNNNFPIPIPTTCLAQSPSGVIFSNYLANSWRACSLAVLTFALLYWIQESWVCLVVLILLLIGVIYQFQDNLLYYPEEPDTSRVIIMRPSMFNMQYEDITLRCKDGILIKAYFIPQPAPLAARMHTIVLFHGNAGNIGHRLPNVQGLQMGVKCNILLVEYRGYGKSQGFPHENGFYLDSQAALDYLAERRDIDANKIIVFGRSLGGAVAIDLATSQEYKDKIAGVIVENTFTSIMEMGSHLFLPLTYIPRVFFKNKYDSAEKILRLRIPILFLSGKVDTLIPPSMMNTLYMLAASDKKYIQIFENGTHNNTWQCSGYYNTISRFLREVSLISSSSSSSGQTTES